MSLHSIIEPAGTLVTGWTLVTQRNCHAADTRNDDDIPLEVACAPAPAENAPAEHDGAEICPPVDDVRPVTTASRWEL